MLSDINTIKLPYYIAQHIIRGLISCSSESKILNGSSIFPELLVKSPSLL